MSRCFPFPPPGYEKKARVDDTDLLKKEKQKEKKHKQDKEKEKRDGKEKRDKDRSKEKHREKKERKERHKDKDKDRDKDKEKNQTSAERKVEGQQGYYNGEHSGSNSLQNSEIKDSIYVEELARRIRDEDRASGSQSVQKVAATDQRRGEVRGMVVEKSIGNRSQEKEKVKDKNEDHRNVNGQRNHVDTRGSEKAFDQRFFGMDQERVAGIVKLMEKKETGKHMEGKEKNKHRESDSKGDKHKNRDREKNKKSKDQDRDKEEKKEKVKEITEQSKEQPKLKENASKLIEGSKDSLDFRNIKSSEPLKLGNVSPAAEGKLGKRKELERNGYLLDNGNWPNKNPRPMSSSHPVENGKKLETCQTAVRFVSEKQELAANNHKVDSKEQKINGLIKSEQKINGLITPEQKINGFIAARPHMSSTKSLAVGVPPVNENGETFSKPPHPDTKYLSRILSVPEMQEWPDVDDQEWLLSCNHLHSTKPSRVSPGTDGTPQVWAEALRIESADISALPYVIPY